ncbi:MAG: helix-turn-helix domain-containing protein [Eubacteriales bacterium]|nr:helix-turn-helix domain-containing protein [Eubacteriales bacterium]MDD3880999.1 helix-turn-helix domain-containing protein [Eubacteriales bacterium]MDD4511932.1 helix-turn-helix domain-containing protein [Eubacteriales bacterium]
MIHISDIRTGMQIFEALDSEVRVNILNLVRQYGEINLNQLAKELGLTNGAITSHIKKLQAAKLIKVRSRSGVRGAQKVCMLLETKIIIDLFDESSFQKNAYVFDIGVGHYTDYGVSPTCGLVTKDAIIGELDDPRYFAFPDRINAELIWFTKGHLTYTLPNSLKLGEECTELQIGMELASEAPGYTTYYPSDISFRINGIPLGFFTSVGEFNDRKGIFTPDWWFPNLGQYGKLKLLTINEAGCFIDGLKISEVTIDSLDLKPSTPLTFTIEASEDAVNQGGVSLFGKGFGDYDSGIAVKMFYKPANNKEKLPAANA